MRLILVRHGQTCGNRHFYVGREDLPLNDTGRAQALRLSELLSGERITAVFSSPLLRAVETANPLADRLGLGILRRSGLMEIDFGSLQGAPKGKIARSLRRDHLMTPLPGGESLADVWRRLEPVSVELIDAVHGGGCPVVVGHYWSNRLLHDMLLGVQLDAALSEGRYKPANGSIVEIEIATAY